MPTVMVKLHQYLSFPRALFQISTSSICYIHLRISDEAIILLNEVAILNFRKCKSSDKWLPSWNVIKTYIYKKKENSVDTPCKLHAGCELLNHFRESYPLCTYFRVHNFFSWDGETCHLKGGSYWRCSLGSGTFCSHVPDDTMTINPFTGLNQLSNALNSLLICA